MPANSGRDVYTERPGRLARLLTAPLGQRDTDDLDLASAEMLEAVVPANRTQNGRRAVGGKLFVTTDRVVFLPHRFDASLSGDAREIRLDEVDDVGVEEPTRSVRAILSAPLEVLFGGGLTDRLRVETVDGTVELFVCDDPATLADRIEGVR